MTYYLSVGILLGLTAGFAPGPLLALVISESLKHGFVSGVKVAVAPLLTDIPIVALTLLVFTQISEAGFVLGLISIAGSIYVLYIGYECIDEKDRTYDPLVANSQSLKKGVITNALSPHPYLFWISVGAPAVAQSIKINFASPLLFVSGFYFCLIGSKILLAFLIGKSRSFLNDKIYKYTMRILGLALMGLSIALFIDGLKLMYVRIT